MQVVSLSKQNIWLTGASSGIGRDLLELLLERNANVFASSRNLDDLNDLLIKYPQQLRLVPVDVADLESVKACVSTIQKSVTHLDKIILNAGVCHYLDMPNFDGECIRKNFAVNFFGIVNCIEQSLPLLLASDCPHLIGMSSSVAYLPIPRAEGYGASKAAVLYMLRALQAHKTVKKIDVSIICPGFVDTPLTAKNNFVMPFLWKSKRAAEYILDGLVARKTEISFPRRLVWLFKFVAILPDALRIMIMSRITNK